jgi:hypothetical protein
MRRRVIQKVIRSFGVSGADSGKPSKELASGVLAVASRIITKLDVPADQVLQGAMGKLDCCIVIGYDRDGDEYFASGVADAGTANWLIDRFKAEWIKDQDA